MSMAAGTRMASVMPCRSFYRRGKLWPRRSANRCLFSDKVGVKPNASSHSAKLAHCGIKVVVPDKPP